MYTHKPQFQWSWDIVYNVNQNRMQWFANPFQSRFKVIYSIVQIHTDSFWIWCLQHIPKNLGVFRNWRQESSPLCRWNSFPFFSWCTTSVAQQAKVSVVAFLRFITRSYLQYVDRCGLLAGWSSTHWFTTKPSCCNMRRMWVGNVLLK